MERRAINLPLHHGRAPAWLFSRMKKLSAGIAEYIVLKYGAEELFMRLSDPVWFQSLGCAVGFDWHSSGVSTTLCGALKEGLKDRDLGIYICGGKGKTSRKTPQDIEMKIKRYKLDLIPSELVSLSRLTAKIDNTLIQDGYQIYHHNFIFDREGNWCVIQQGMNVSLKYARRYHWHSEDTPDLFSDPHKGIISSVLHKDVLNIVAKESRPAQGIMLDISREHPEKILKEWVKIKTIYMPRRHNVIPDADIRKENLRKILVKTYESAPIDFKSLVLTRGVGPKTIRALALISELMAGTPVSRRDPAVFSFAHGGKDGHPYPVNRKVYDKSVLILREAVEKLKVLKLDEKKRILSRIPAI